MRSLGFFCFIFSFFLFSFPELLRARVAGSSLSSWEEYSSPRRYLEHFGGRPVIESSFFFSLFSPPLRARSGVSLFPPSRRRTASFFSVSFPLSFAPRGRLLSFFPFVAANEGFELFSSSPRLFLPLPRFFSAGRYVLSPFFLFFDKSWSCFFLDFFSSMMACVPASRFPWSILYRLPGGIRLPFFLPILFRFFFVFWSFFFFSSFFLYRERRFSFFFSPQGIGVGFSFPFVPSFLWE